MSYTIIIPSANPSNLEACVRALRSAGESGPIVGVMDQVSSPPSLGGDPSFRAVYAAPPFSFAHSVNFGIAATPPNHDVILLNDDVLLLTSFGFAELDGHSQEYDIVSARVRGPAHPVHAERSSAAAPRNDVARVGRAVPFVAVLLRRRILEVVGELDERFRPGSFEDDDYCLRARMCGGKIGVYNGCLVDHETLPHAFRPAGEKDKYDYRANLQRFTDKWGFGPGTR